jgi:hypothetical protein
MMDEEGRVAALLYVRESEKRHEWRLNGDRVTREGVEY